MGMRSTEPPFLLPVSQSFSHSLMRGVGDTRQMETVAGGVDGDKEDCFLDEITELLGQLLEATSSLEFWICEQYVTITHCSKLGEPVFPLLAFENILSDTTNCSRFLDIKFGHQFPVFFRDIPVLLTFLCPYLAN